MSHIDLHCYLDAEVGRYPAAGVRSLEAIRASLQAELAEIVEERMDAPDWAQAYAEHCPVAGASSNDYLLRELDLGDPGRLLAGIHFLGRVERKAFVNIEARTVSLKGRDDVRRVVDALRSEFSSLRPTWVRFFQPEGLAEPSILELLPESRVDMNLVAGRILELEQPVAANLRLELVTGDPRSLVDIVGAWYADLHARHPQLRQRLAPSTEGQLASCADEGTLFEARLDGERVGVIGVCRERRRGMEGWRVVEEVVARPYRRLGLAMAMQRGVLARLDAGADDVLFGTVAHENIASLRTALGVGRSVVGRWVLVPASASFGGRGASL